MTTLLRVRHWADDRWCNELNVTKNLLFYSVLFIKMKIINRL